MANFVEAVLPPLGEDRLIVVSEKGGLIRHGTSLAVMSKASQLINDEFDSDPQKDWEKWSERKGFSLYYALFENSHEETVSALRAILDLGEGPNIGRPKRFIIDYVHTKPEKRGIGLASLLTKFSLDIAKSMNANVMVLSLEDAASYWMQNSFILEESKRLNNRLNVFTDTYLLKLNTNIEDLGEAEDDIEREAEEAEEETGENNVSIDEDEDLQRALIASNADTSAQLTTSQNVTGNEDEDDDLQRALMASLGYN